jgi:Zn-dependent protease
LQPSSFLIAIFEFVLLIFSLSVHECAHAWMASRLGDQTARLQGRVTLNPMYHVDPIGTLIFPAIMIFGPFFGLITRNFRKIVRDDNLTTLAGPASNLLIVLVAFAVLAVVSVAVPNGHQLALIAFMGGIVQGAPPSLQALLMLCRLAILINLCLCFFNLLPIPPLDGSRLVRNTLPYNAVRAYDRIPMWGSYMLMIFLGPTILGALIGPALRMVLWGLVRV